MRIFVSIIWLVFCALGVCILQQTDASIETNHGVFSNYAQYGEPVFCTRSSCVGIVVANYDGLECSTQSIASYRLFSPNASGFGKCRIEILDRSSKVTFNPSDQFILTTSYGDSYCSDSRVTAYNKLFIGICVPLPEYNTSYMILPDVNATAAPQLYVAPTTLHTLTMTIYRCYSPWNCTNPSSVAEPDIYSTEYEERGCLPGNVRRSVGFAGLTLNECYAGLSVGRHSNFMYSCSGNRDYGFFTTSYFTSCNDRKIIASIDTVLGCRDTSIATSEIYSCTSFHAIVDTLLEVSNSPPQVISNLPIPASSSSRSLFGSYSSLLMKTLLAVVLALNTP